MFSGAIVQRESRSVDRGAVADQVWFVEDDDDYALLLDVTAGRAGIPHKRRFADGQAVLTQLSALEDVAEPLPALFVVDVEMPGISGLDLLAQLRSRPATRNIPIVMLTSSLKQEHVDAAHKFGATEYLVKPAEYTELLTLLAMMRGLWVHGARGKGAPVAFDGPSI